MMKYSWFRPLDDDEGLTTLLGKPGIEWLTFKAHIKDTIITGPLHTNMVCSGAAFTMYDTLVWIANVNLNNSTTVEVNDGLRSLEIVRDERFLRWVHIREDSNVLIGTNGVSFMRHGENDWITPDGKIVSFDDLMGERQTLYTVVTRNGVATKTDTDTEWRA